jgi:FSR family fosmidomycin resistance protein-like MFS transporter
MPLWLAPKTIPLLNFMRFQSIGLLIFAHTATDINQGAIPVLLPFFIAAHHISYAAAASIVFAINMASTLAQPVLGYISDRRSRPWLIPVAMLCAGLGVSLTGLVPSFRLGLIVVALSGLGMAAFHPEGARLIHHLAGDRKATAMSFFAIGGQLGFVIGPLLATAAMLFWGLRGSISLLVPTAIVAGLVIYSLSRGPAFDQPESTGRPRLQATNPGHTEWVAFAFLSVALLSRSVIFYGLNTFIPLFWIDVFHQSKAAAGTALTLLMTSAIGGNLLGGRMSDRFGYRGVALVGFAFLTVLLPLFARAGSHMQALLLLIPLGAALSVPTSPLVVLGQSYLPNNVGLASGVTLGLGFSFGGIMTPVLGWIADRHGLHAAITVVALIPALCTGLTIILLLLKGSAVQSARAGADPS